MGCGSGELTEEEKIWQKQACEMRDMGGMFDSLDSKALELACKDFAAFKKKYPKEFKELFKEPQW